jgi:hypothetical protein
MIVSAPFSLSISPESSYTGWSQGGINYVGLRIRWQGSSSQKIKT